MQKITEHFQVRQYSVADYQQLNGKVFGGMKVRYMPQRAKFYVSLAYNSPNFDLNRRDIKRISNPFNQRLKIWPIPVANFEDLQAVLRRADKRAKRHLVEQKDASGLENQISKNADEEKNPFEVRLLSEQEGKQVAESYLNQQFGDVWVSELKGYITLEFPYECAGFYKIKENIKRLKGWSYQDRIWKVPFSQAEKVQSILDFAESCQKIEAERLKKSDMEQKKEIDPMPVKEKIEIERKPSIDEISQSIEALKKYIRKKGVYPKKSNCLLGETVLNTMDKKGSGECWVIESDKIWFVRNNGRDQDDWRYNNISTKGGGGAIGYHIPYHESTAGILRKAERVLMEAG